MARWKVFYSVGPPVSSRNCSPFAIAKRTDVQVIVQGNSDHRWVTLSGYDFYAWDDRGGGARWFRATYSGLMQYLMRPGHKCVLFGYEIDKTRFNEIFEMARKDAMFEQPKSGYERGERKPGE